MVTNPMREYHPPASYSETLKAVEDAHLESITPTRSYGKLKAPSPFEALLEKYHNAVRTLDETEALILETVQKLDELYAASAKPVRLIVGPSADKPYRKAWTLFVGADSQIHLMEFDASPLAADLGGRAVLLDNAAAVMGLVEALVDAVKVCERQKRKSHNDLPTKVLT